MPAPALSAAKLRGRPAAEAPRNCVAYARLTTAEYEALLGLLPARVSLSDFVRDLVSEALLSRLRAYEQEHERWLLEGSGSSRPAPGLLSSR